jgi:hypothetical protein
MSSKVRSVRYATSMIIIQVRCNVQLVPGPDSKAQLPKAILKSAVVSAHYIRIWRKPCMPLPKKPGTCLIKPLLR